MVLQQENPHHPLSAPASCQAFQGDQLRLPQILQISHQCFHQTSLFRLLRRQSTIKVELEEFEWRYEFYSINFD